MGQSWVSQPRGKTVLVVDDEPVIRMLVAETLEEQGYDIIEAEDAAAAALILNSPARVDLLVTDITLPGQSGRELAGAAKRLRPELKILFMTGYAHYIEANGKDLGTEIITKPFSLDGLAKKIHGMMAG
ncbi:response regulator [Acidocella sp.]|uniref:response regulator n=1 Tax=Acidocella sp. TaxID=50710 RepID=UPI003CFF45C4